MKISDKVKIAMIKRKVGSDFLANQLHAPRTYIDSRLLKNDWTKDDIFKLEKNNFLN